MNRARSGVVIGLLVLAVIARLLPGPRTIDDAYITFRYAKNILSGAGFVFNPGEAVLGTTTPLYALLMSGLGALFGGEEANFPQLAWLVNALADGLTCALLYLIGRRLASEWVGLASGLLWAIAPYSVTFAIGGLETSLYVFLLITTTWGFLEKRYTLAAFAASLAFLARVDALILLGPLAVYWLIQAWRKKERLPVQAVLVVAIPVVAWLLYAAFTFGSPFPHSVQAKLVAYRLAAGESLIRLIQHYATPFFEYNTLGSLVGIAGGLIVYPFLSALGTIGAVRKDPRCLVFCLYPWLYFATFAVMNPLIFRWYLTPPLPFWFLLILMGADRLLRLIRLSGVQRAITVGVVLLAVASSLSEWRWRPDHGPRRPAPDMAYIQLELLYQQAAAYVNDVANDKTVLAAGDVGVLGYSTGLTILDLVGLNSPQAVDYYPLPDEYYVINYAVAPRLVLDYQPDILVILEAYGRNGLLLDREFQQRYSLLQKIETDMYGSDGMLIFQRNP